jgi:hypothetical protein
MVSRHHLIPVIEPACGAAGDAAFWQAFRTTCSLSGVMSFSFRGVDLFAQLNSGIEELEPSS